MNRFFGLFVVALLLSQINASTIYGVTTRNSPSQTETFVCTVEVDLATGAFSPVADNYAIIDMGNSQSIGGIAAVNQKEGILYFADNAGTTFVYGVNLKTGETPPPVSTNSEIVNALVYDTTNDQLLITAQYGNDTILLSFPFDDSIPAAIVFNYSSASIEAEYLWAQTADPTSSTYYAIYSKAATPTTYVLIQFDVTSPDNVKSSTFPCSQVPFTLHYDAKQAKLLGISVNEALTNFYYYEVTGTTCTVVPIESLTGGTVTTSTYDPSSSTIHFFLEDGTGNYLYSYNSATKNMTNVLLADYLNDIAVYLN